MTHSPDYFPSLSASSEESAFASNEAVLSFMASKGYRARAKVSTTFPLTMANDLIFVKEGFKEEVELEDISGWRITFPIT